MMRVLLLAPLCCPLGSETMTGFQECARLGKYVDAVVVTHCYFQDAIDKYGGLGPTEPAYLDVGSLSHITQKLITTFKLAAASSTLVSFPLAVGFERSVWRRFRRELSRGDFDLVHRLTPVSSVCPAPWLLGHPFLS